MIRTHDTVVRDYRQRTENREPYVLQTISSERSSTVQYSTVQYRTVQYSTVPYSTVQYSTVPYSTVNTALYCSITGVHTGGKSAHCVPRKQHTDISGTRFSVLSEHQKIWALRAHPSSTCEGLGICGSCCGALHDPWGSVGITCHQYYKKSSPASKKGSKNHFLGGVGSQYSNIIKYTLKK